MCCVEIFICDFINGINLITSLPWTKWADNSFWFIFSRSRYCVCVCVQFSTFIPLSTHILHEYTKIYRFEYIHTTGKRMKMRERNNNNNRIAQKCKRTLFSCWFQCVLECAPKKPIDTVINMWRNICGPFFSISYRFICFMQFIDEL